MYEAGEVNVTPELALAFRCFKGSPQSRTCIVMVHANGLCQDLWVPVIEDLYALITSTNSMRPHIVTYDQRSHGRSDVDHKRPYDWALLGKDALAVVDHVTKSVLPPCNRFLGVGHSLGGNALFGAEVYRPGFFNFLLLIEPIIFAEKWNLKGGVGNPLATAALKRRDRFDSIRQARTAYQGRGMFEKWDPRCFDAYLTGAFKSDPNSEAVQLRCPPWAESEFFRTSESWNRTINVSQFLPQHLVMIIGGHSPSQTCARLLVGELTQSLTSKTLELHVFPELGHLVPQESPTEIAGHIADCLSRVESGQVSVISKKAQISAKL